MRIYRPAKVSQVRNLKRTEAMQKKIIKVIYSAVLALTILLNTSCALQKTQSRLELRPKAGTCEVIISAAPAAIGALRLWVPEAIVSNTGSCSYYPVGQPWVQQGNKFIHEVQGEGIYGPGNVQRVDEQTVECVGIRIPLDSPVQWHTTLVPTQDGVDFKIRLTNVGNKTIHKAAAAICFKFLQRNWWSEENVYVLSGGKVRSLAELGWDAGRPNSFQAYLLQGASFDNVFYQEFWGFNHHRLDKPVMVSYHPDANICVAITAENAYFLHSNKANPCTDIMLAFGNLKPGKSAESAGQILIRSGTPHNLLTPPALAAKVSK